MPVVRQVIPSDPPLLVDGHTPFVAQTPPLRDARGLPLDGRTCEVALVASEDGEPIHPTLAGYAVSIGDGVYSRGFTPRALYLHLPQYAGRIVLLRAKIPGEPAAFTRFRVVWQMDLFPVPQN